MIEAKIIGNIFDVDRKINIKIILSSIVSTFLLALLKKIFENQTISENFTLQDFTYPLIGSTIILYALKYKLIKKFIKKYFRFKLKIMIYIAFYILIGIRIFALPDIYSYFLAVFFFLSGFQRIIIQETKALFFADISEFMNFIQIYGYTRAAFFVIIILYFSKIIILNLSIFGLLYSLLILVFQISFLANLYPYYTKHKDIKKTIMILRKIAQNKNMKINNLNPLIDTSDRFIKQQLNRLTLAGYISMENGCVKLKGSYQKIYEGK